jgi:anti-sigma regulatory factor (Ser/Thr protein kinase)
VTITLTPLDSPVTDAPSKTTRRFLRDGLAPQAARNFVAAALIDYGIDDDTVEVAKLLTSEMVTNAAIYADRGQIHVAVHIDAKTIEVVVTDAGRTRATLPTTVPGCDAENGRGWVLIEALATDCGIERIGGGNGHRAFFILDLPEGGVS